ncbi:hypothetical protein BLOT_006510 [Blomia tropicalis]|nr:hypothetical protein BLOT_006510 [Blomia tropicalis]
MELELRKQCENYLNKIKRQEQEIRSYRQHIENIEEDYQNLSNELISAEMANRQNEKKTISYQKTIASLKVELDSFYNTERTNEKETISQSSVSNISFSGESNIMVKNVDSETPTCNSKKQVCEHVQKVATIFDDNYQKVLAENVELKLQIENLKKELRRIKVDIEDYKLMLHDHERKNSIRQQPTNVVNSTPLKITNFMSYQELNMENNSFSIDYDDYDCDNMHLNGNFQNELLYANKKPIFKDRFYHLNISEVPKDVSSIENQELPSILYKGIDETTIKTNVNLTKRILGETVQQNNYKDYSSIEDEQFPPITLPPDSSSSCNVSTVDTPIPPNITDGFSSENRNNLNANIVTNKHGISRFNNLFLRPYSKLVFMTNVYQKWLQFHFLIFSYNIKHGNVT